MVDSILNSLQEDLATKAEQFSGSRHLVGGPELSQDRSTSFYRRTPRLLDLSESREAQINARWIMDSHVLEKVYLESPCNPTMHVSTCLMKSLRYY